MSNAEHPISAHVDEYIKTLRWSDAATQDVKTFVIGNLRGFAAHLAAIESQTDILDDPRVDKEIRRWQDAIRDKLIDVGAPDWKIDGAGCDSGDPLDFTLAEVGQGVGYFIDQLEELRAATTPPAVTEAGEQEIQR